MSSLPALPTAILLIPLMVACGGARDKRAAPAAPREPEDVEILDRGAEPRTPLRYRIAPGTRRRFEMTFDVAALAGAGSNPVIRLRGEYEFAATATPGIVAIRETIVEAEALVREGGKTKPAGVLSGAIAQLRGSILGFELSERGHTGPVRVDLASSPSAEQLLQSMSDPYTRIVFPVSPVGVGARWRVHDVGDASSVEVESDTVYELVAVAGTTVTMHATMKLVLPPGGALQGTGKGTIDAELDLATHVGTTTTKVDIDLTAEGKPRTRLHTQMTTRFE